MINPDLGSWLFLSEIICNVGPSPSLRSKLSSSAGEGTIDVFVALASDDTSMVVGIENKIDAAVGPAQLLRYARGLVVRASGRNVVLVLLAPTEREDNPGEVPGCKFSPVTYRDVITALEAALAERRATSNNTGFDLARHYLEILRMDIVPEAQPEIDRIRLVRFAESGSLASFGAK